MNAADIVVGRRYRIHPATDWYMRGATHGTVTRISGDIARVELENGLGRITNSAGTPKAAIHIHVALLDEDNR